MDNHLTQERQLSRHPNLRIRVPCLKSSKLVLRTTCLRNSRQPVALSLSYSPCLHDSCWREKRRPGVSQTTAWWHGISCGSPCSTRPGRSGALGPVSGISHPMFTLSNTASFCSLVEGTAQGSGLRILGRPRQVTRMLVFLVTCSPEVQRIMTAPTPKSHQKLQFPELPTRVPKVAFENWLLQPKKKKGVPDKAPLIVIPVILPFTSQTSPAHQSAPPRKRCPSQSLGGEIRAQQK